MNWNTRYSKEEPWDKKPEDGASHCKDCADKVANQTSRGDN